MTSIESLYEIYCQFPEICIDSRKIEKGVLFFAIQGDRFDGHDFAQEALEKGAAYVVVHKQALASSDPRFLLVADTLVALQQLARHHRRQLTFPVLAITGSNGKTTTKELVAAVLGQRYSVLFTPGNFNNHIGLPLTLLQATKNHEILVIEMGANHQGEIDQLSHIAEPSHGLITNIGLAHLEGFGGIEGVKKGKSELYRFLAAQGGVAFINRDEDFLSELSSTVEKRLYYGQGTGKFEGQLLGEQPFLKVGFGEGQEINSQLVGIYNLPNILTAIAVGQYFKVPEEKITKAIESYTPENNRSQLLHQENHLIILDAYNANPTSMEVALRAFAERQEPRKWAILGDMLELGEYSEEAHSKILKLALELSFDQLIAVGPAFQQAAEAQAVSHFLNVDTLKKWWDKQDKSGLSILLKASRGIGLERLVKTS